MVNLVNREDRLPVPRKPESTDSDASVSEATPSESVASNTVFAPTPASSLTAQPIAEQSAAARRAYNQVLEQTLQQHHTARALRSVPAPAETLVSEALTWNAPHPQPGCYVFRSLEEMAQIWLLHGGDALSLPPVDFQSATVLAVFSGEGHFRECVTINRLKQTADRIQAYVCSYTRPWKIRNAMSVIQIPRTEQPIQFVQLV